MEPNIIKIIKKGGVGVLPTDTLYGLVGSALHKQAVERILRLKKRNPQKPLIILISSLRALRYFGVLLDKETKTFLKTIWPGEVSGVLEVGQGRTRGRTYDLSYLCPLNNTLAFRLPKSKWLLKLLKKTGPLVAPSANPEGLAPACSIEQAKQYFSSDVDFYFDKGERFGLPSTIVSFKEGEAVVLRQGAVKIGFQKQWLLPAITSTNEENSRSNWKNKIKEIDILGIKKVALFLTLLQQDKRKELYGLLEKTSLQQIPLVHIRSDMEAWELDYLIKRWSVLVFNTHSQQEFPFKYNLSKFHKMIFVENVFVPFSKDEIEQFAGICLDVSHLENDRLLRPEMFEFFTGMLEKYSIGCNHISPTSKTAKEIVQGSGFLRYDRHVFNKLSEFDYLKKYPLKYFSRFCAIEVENSLKDQLKAIDYIYKLMREGEQGGKFF